MSGESEGSVLPFYIGSAGVRGRLLRLPSMPAATLRRCGYPLPAAFLLAEAQSLAALLGSDLKNGKRFTLHASGNGAFSDLSVDCYADGLLRSYLAVDHERLRRWTSGKNGDAPNPFLYLGQGHLAFTLDAGADAPPYQGIVALEGTSLTAAVMRYLEQSEQLASVVRLALTARGAANDGAVLGYTSAALLLQKMGGDNEEGFTRIAALTKTLTDDELSDRSLAPERLLYRLFNEEEVTVYPAKTLYHGCTCSDEKMQAVLKTYAPEAFETGEPVEVTCRFCGETRRIS